VHLAVARRALSSPNYFTRPIPQEKAKRRVEFSKKQFLFQNPSSKTLSPSSHLSAPALCAEPESLVFALGLPRMRLNPESHDRKPALLFNLLDSDGGSRE